MIFREPPGILQEVGIPINNIISGCNSYKKLVEWLRAQSAGLRKSVRVSECHKKKQEVSFDLLSFLKCDCDSPPTPRLRRAQYPEPAGWRAGLQKLQPADRSLLLISA